MKVFICGQRRSCRALSGGGIVDVRGFEGLAAARVEAAEELVELQPQRLDAHQGRLDAHDDDVAEHEAEDGVAPARLREGVDYEAS